MIYLKQEFSERVSQKRQSTIAAGDQSSTPVIDFEEEDKKLHITDPFFAFYLRWGQLGTVVEPTVVEPTPDARSTSSG